MSTDQKRVVITLSTLNYAKLAERLGTDDTDEITSHVKDAVIQLAGGKPEVSRDAQRKLDRIAKREAVLAEKKAALAEARAIEGNALMPGSVSKPKDKPVTPEVKAPVTSDSERIGGRHGNVQPVHTK